MLEFSETLALTIFKGSTTLIGICVAILALLAGLWNRRKKAAEDNNVILKVDVRKLFYRLRNTIILFAASMMLSLFWIFSIQSPSCENEIIASPISHFIVILLMLTSVISFILAFFSLLWSISSIDFHMLGDG